MNCNTAARFGIKRIVLSNTHAQCQPVPDSGGTSYLIAPLEKDVSGLTIEAIEIYGEGAVKVDGSEAASGAPFTVSGLEYGENKRKIEIVYPDEGGRSCDVSIYRALPVNTGKGAASGGSSGRFLNNGDGTVTDLNTGLVWVRNPSSVADKMSWNQAFDRIGELNAKAAFGTTGWRLPNINELNSLVDYDVENAWEWLEEAGFEGIRGIYWSSTTYAVDTGDAWNAWFVHSHAPNCPGKTANVFIWPVRSRGIVRKTGAHELAGYRFEDSEDGGVPQGIAWPVPRFRDNLDGTMTDNMTGLVWMKDAGITGMNTFADSRLFLEGLNDGTVEGNCGYTDWRIPGIREMQTLVHYGKTDCSQWLEGLEAGFENVGNFYWTQTVYSTSRGRQSYWFISLEAGVTAEFGKDSRLSFWPVRGGG